SCWETHLPLLGIILQNLSEDALVKELDKIAEYVASILVGKPSDIKLGIGDFNMAASVALYSAICYARGSFVNGKDYLVKLCAIVGYSGWLPCSKLLEGTEKVVGPTRSLPIFLSMPKMMVSFQIGSVKLYNHSGHFPYMGLQQAQTIRKWITDKMEIGSIWVIRNLEETPEDEVYVEEDFLP
ncbi:hypothetical protein H5410_052723, partial [Solanum commersonii]